MRIGTIKQIWRYPAKSMAGEQIESAKLEPQGFADDRTWAVRDESSGEIVGGKKLPKLMMLKARYVRPPTTGFGPEADSSLELTFPDGRVVSSDDAYVDAILSMFLGRQVALVSRAAANNKQHYALAKPLTPAETRYVLGMKPEDPSPDFSSFSLRLMLTLSKYTSPPGTYYDVYPLHFMTTAALDTMRGHYPQGDFRVERYRPSFVIEADPEFEGIIENDWRGMNLRIGKAVMRCNHPTIRCSMPGAAQVGMDADSEIPRAVMKYAGQHLGAYATPLNNERIQVGDVVEVLPRPGAKLFFFLDLIGRKLKAALMNASESALNKQDAKRKKAEQDSAPGYPAGFRLFTLSQREQESQDVVSFVFTDPERSCLPRFIPGQHLVFAIPQGDNTYAYRSYSLSASSAERSSYQISVKREVAQQGDAVQPGKASTWLHDHCQRGSQLLIKDPGGKFGAIVSDSTPLVLISSGIGITPFLSMLQSLADENSQREVRLFHGIRDLGDFAFSELLQSLEQRLPNLSMHVFVSQHDESGAEPPEFNGQITSGRMSVELIKGAIRLETGQYYVCGKPEFSKQMRDDLLGLGINESDIHCESFGRSLISNVRAEQDAHEIRYLRSGQTLRWSAEHDNLLDLSEANGIACASGCRYGACQACEATLLAGKVSYPDGVEPPAGKNKVLLCSARPESELELEL